LALRRKLPAAKQQSTAPSFLSFREDELGRLHVNRGIQISFLIALVTLAAVGWLAYRGMVETAESEGWVLHTHLVIEDIQGVVIAMENIESAYRGFAATGEESFLKSYASDIALAENLVETVRSLTADNPVQRQRIPAVEALIARQVRFGGQAIALRRSQGPEAASAWIRSGPGGRVMQDTFPLMESMRREELRLLELRSRDASRRLANTRASIVLGAAMALVLVVGAGWRLHTESELRAATERTLRASEEQFRSLMESAPDAIVVLRSDGRIALLNAQTERLFGFAREELLGRSAAEIIPDGLVDCLAAEKLPAGTLPKSRIHRIDRGIELVGQRKDGRTVPIEAMLSPLETVNESLVTVAIRDVSARKHGEQLLARTLGELETSHEELRRLAAVTYHELQEPLRLATSFAQLLARRYRGKMGADADDFIDYIVGGCVRMKSLIRDLATYSTVGQERSRQECVSAERALKEALTNLKAEIGQSGATVVHGQLPEVCGHCGELVTVFENLIGNAIKYRAEEKPRVNIAAERKGGEWVFSVRDNGIGIDPRYFGKLFVLFQRLHGPREYPGTGVGLAICKKIVERWGGRIWVESELGRGSTFCFALPAERAAVPSLRAS
jgi:PAS domain S-box-containing protein